MGVAMGMGNGTLDKGECRIETSVITGFVIVFYVLEPFMFSSVHGCVKVI